MHPTAFADQFHAATRHAHSVLRTVADIDGNQPTPEDPWITQQATALIKRLTTGRVRPCPHIGTTPGVAHTAAWTPDRLHCLDCPLPADPAGEACDHCGNHDPDGLYTGIAAVGPVLMHYGRCGTCTPKNNPLRVQRSSPRPTPGR